MQNFKWAEKDGKQVLKQGRKILGFVFEDKNGWAYAFGSPNQIGGYIAFSPGRPADGQSNELLAKARVLENLGFFAKAAETLKPETGRHTDYMYSLIEHAVEAGQDVSGLRANGLYL